jgi:hypothetical protein
MTRARSLARMHASVEAIGDSGSPCFPQHGSKRLKRSIEAVLKLLLAAALGACGDEGGAADMHVPDMALPPLCTPDEIGDGGIPATWANVETLLDRTCATGVCHFTGFTVPGGAGLDLSHGHAYMDMVNKQPADSPNFCGGTIVTPFRPEQSFLMVKLTVPTGQQCNPKGEQMPVAEIFQPLPDCEIDLIRRWILSGAPPP